MLNPEAITMLQALGDIQQFLAPAPAHVTLGGSRVVVGLKLTF